MAISSIHIEKGNAGFLSHNDRSRPTKNSIFSDEENEVSNTAKEAFEIYRNELAKRSEAYTSRTKQKLQAKAITHLSAIINLNSKHTLEDLKPLINHLESELDTKVFQVSIHRDEGHIDDETKEPIKNYHAHLEFMGLDNEGRSVRKKLDRKFLSNLQSKTAEFLNMERGSNYAKERKRRPKRLGSYEFKDFKEREEKSKLATKKELKKEISKYREKLKEMGAAREDYARLEEVNRVLKKKIENKDLTIEELKKTSEGRSNSLGIMISEFKKIADFFDFQVSSLEDIRKIKEIVKKNIDDSQSEIADLKSANQQKSFGNQQNEALLNAFEGQNTNKMTIESSLATIEQMVSEKKLKEFVKKFLERENELKHSQNPTNSRYNSPFR